jgi:nitrogen fixation-related uncharacterized protein
MINNKAQGLSITVVIVAAIALIVLVVLVLVFTGKIGQYSENIETCEAKGGKCLADCNEEAGKIKRDLNIDCIKPGTTENGLCCLTV